MNDQELKNAQDIMNNPGNPKHEAYQRGDEAAIAEVNRVYQKMYPGKTDDGLVDVSAMSFTSDGPNSSEFAELMHGSEQAGGDLPTQESVEKEMQAEWAQAESVLRNDPEFSGDYDANLSAIGDYLRASVSSDEDKQVLAKIFGAVGNDPDAVRFALKLAKQGGY